MQRVLSLLLLAALIQSVLSQADYTRICNWASTRTTTPGWTLDGSFMQYANAKLNSQTLFGPTGTFSRRFARVDIATDLVSMGGLPFLERSCDLFWFGWISDGSISSTELALLSQWVSGGRILFLNCDDSAHDDACAYFGHAVGATTTTGPYHPTATGAADGIFNGPFGAITTAGTFAGSGNQIGLTVGTATSLAVDPAGTNSVVLKSTVGSGFVYYFGDVDFISDSTLGTTNNNSIVNNNDRLLANMFSLPIPAQTLRAETIKLCQFSSLHVLPTTDRGWTLDGAQMANTLLKLNSPLVFGPSGIVSRRFTRIDIASDLVALGGLAYLNTNCDMFFHGWMGDGSVSSSEYSVISQWISQGHVLIATCDDTAHDDVCNYFSRPLASTTATIPFHPTTPLGVSDPLFTGPFGSFGVSTTFTGSGNLGTFAPSTVGTTVAVDASGNPSVLKLIQGDGVVFLLSDVDMISDGTLSAGVIISTPNDKFFGNLFSYKIPAKTYPTEKVKVCNIASARAQTSWTLDGTSFIGVNAKLNSAALFGPTGAVNRQFIRVDINNDLVSLGGANFLNQNCDMFYFGWVVDGVISSAEFSLLSNWVSAGHVMIANCDDTGHDDVCNYFGHALITSGGFPFHPTATGTFDPIFTGPFGSIGAAGFFNGAALSSAFTGTTSLAADAGGNTVVLKQTLGSGYIIFLGDTDIISDSTIAVGNPLIGNTNDMLLANIFALPVPSKNTATETVRICNLASTKAGTSWTLDGGSLTQAMAKLTNGNLFGPFGSVNRKFTRVDIASDIGTLGGLTYLNNNCDMFYHGWAADGSVTSTEYGLLSSWVNGGKILIVNCDDTAHDDACVFFGHPLRNTVSWPYHPQVQTDPLFNGPFGFISSASSYTGSGFSSSFTPTTGTTCLASDITNNCTVLKASAGTGFIYFIGDTDVISDSTLTFTPNLIGNNNDVFFGNLFAQQLPFRSYPSTNVRICNIAQGRNINSGDAGWSLDGAFMTYAMLKLNSPSLFGPFGIVNRRFTRVDLTTSLSTLGLSYLNANCDYVYHGWFGDGSLVTAEYSVLSSFVTGGKILIMNCDDVSHDDGCVFFGRNLRQSVSPPYHPTLAGASDFIFDGPFGTLTTSGTYTGYALSSAFTAVGGTVSLAVDSTGNTTLLRNPLGSGFILFVGDSDAISDFSVSPTNGIVNNNDVLMANMFSLPIPVGSGTATSAAATSAAATSAPTSAAVTSASGVATSAAATSAAATSAAATSAAATSAGTIVFTSAGTSAAGTSAASGTSAAATSDSSTPATSAATQVFTTRVATLVGTSTENSVSSSSTVSVSFGLIALLLVALFRQN